MASAEIKAVKFCEMNASGGFLANLS
ncbi:MAG: hypothetical protein ACD_11C00058G0001, partial [uncultured bacterium]